MPNILDEMYFDGTISYIPTSMPNDPYLSYSSKGMLIFILHQPPDTEFTIPSLMSLLRIGRDKTYSFLQEIKEAGYYDMRQVMKKNSKGKWKLTKSIRFFFDVSRTPQEIAKIIDLYQAEDIRFVYPKAKKKSPLL